jgi:hypothetical protein
VPEPGVRRLPGGVVLAHDCAESNKEIVRYFHHLLDSLPAIVRSQVMPFKL